MESSELIGDAIRVALAAQLDGWTVVRRKAPTLPPRAELPVAVVCVGEEGDVEHVTAGSDPWDMVTYPATVALFFSGDGKELADVTTIRTTRRLARGVLNAATTYTSVPGFCDVTGGGAAVYAAAARAANQNESVLTAKVQVLESRGN